MAKEKKELTPKDKFYNELTGIIRIGFILLVLYVIAQFVSAMDFMG